MKWWKVWTNRSDDYFENGTLLWLKAGVFSKHTLTVGFLAFCKVEVSLSGECVRNTRSVLYENFCPQPLYLLFYFGAILKLRRGDFLSFFSPSLLQH